VCTHTPIDQRGTSSSFRTLRDAAHHGNDGNHGGGGREGGTRAPKTRIQCGGLQSGVPAKRAAYLWEPAKDRVS